MSNKKPKVVEWVSLEEGRYYVKSGWVEGFNNWARKNGKFESAYEKTWSFPAADHNQLAEALWDFYGYTEPLPQPYAAERPSSVVTGYNRNRSGAALGGAMAGAVIAPKASPIKPVSPGVTPLNDLQIEDYDTHTAAAEEYENSSINDDVAILVDLLAERRHCGLSRAEYKIIKRMLTERI